MNRDYFFKTEDDFVKFILDRVENKTSIRLHKLMFYLYNNYIVDYGDNENYPDKLADINMKIGKLGPFVPDVVVKWREGYYDDRKIRGYVKAETGFEQTVYMDLGNQIRELNKTSDIDLTYIVKDFIEWDEKDIGEEIVYG